MDVGVHGKKRFVRDRVVYTGPLFKILNVTSFTGINIFKQMRHPPAFDMGQYNVNASFYKEVIEDTNFFNKLVFISRLMVCYNKILGDLLRHVVVGYVVDVFPILKQRNNSLVKMACLNLCYRSWL